MNNLIAIWGNAGAGKSLLSCALGGALTKGGKNVIVLSADKLTPMLGVFFPFMESTKEHSLGALLSGGVFTEQLVKKIQIHKDNRNLGFMALSRGENNLAYQTNWNMDFIHQLVDLLFKEGFADYLVIDCTPDIFADNMTLYALQNARHVIRVLSPDSRGLAFLDAQLPILRGGAFGEEHITVLSNAYAYSPAKQMQKDYGFDYILPHCKDAYGAFIGGKLIKNLWNKDGVVFTKALKELEERVSGHEQS